MKDVPMEHTGRPEISEMMWMLDQIPTTIIVLTKEGLVRYVNAAYTKATGFQPDEVVGKPAHALIAGDIDEEMLGRLSEAIRAGGQTEGEMRLLSKDRKNHWQRFYVAAVRDDDGATLHAVWVSTEITQQKELERQFLQAQRMEAVGQLAGGIAHDFNNILMVITGLSENMLGRLPADSPLRKYCESVLNAGLRAAKLTHQLLAFSRRQILKPTITAVNDVVKELRGLIASSIEDNIRFSIDLAPNAGHIKIDQSRLEQVLMNLVVNARDACPGGGTIRMATENVELHEDHVDFRPEIRPGRYVMISVSDSGAGMDAVTANRIFEPFFTTKAKGTGLGLSTAYGIVKQSDGYIYVHSHPGKGTTFKIFFPMTGEDAKATASARTGASPDHLGGKENILIVEDDEEVRAIMSDVLEQWGYTVRAEQSGEEALRVSRTELARLDLLVTDIVLPGIDGIQLSERLLEQRPGLKTIFVSGYARGSNFDESKLKALDSFLEKPFAIRDLLKMVRVTLDR